VLTGSDLKKSSTEQAGSDLSTERLARSDFVESNMQSSTGSHNTPKAAGAVLGCCCGWNPTVEGMRPPAIGVTAYSGECQGFCNPLTVDPFTVDSEQLERVRRMNGRTGTACLDSQVSQFES
jgi:hypothetical protein